jgi:hypothetical protein
MENEKVIPGVLGLKMFVSPASELTKLELASLMIAQEIATHFTEHQDVFLASRSVEIAKAVLEECNK